MPHRVGTANAGKKLGTANAIGREIFF